MPRDDRDERRDLLGRIGRLLPGGSIREVAMFGAIAVMFDEAMLVAVNGDGSLLVRVAPEADAALLDRGGATRAEMGAGRSMGIGWIRVDGDVIAADAELAMWLDHALRRRGHRQRAGTDRVSVDTVAESSLMPPRHGVVRPEG